MNKNKKFFIIFLASIPVMIALFVFGNGKYFLKNNNLIVKNIGEATIKDSTIKVSDTEKQNTAGKELSVNKISSRDNLSVGNCVITGGVVSKNKTSFSNDFGSNYGGLNSIQSNGLSIEFITDTQIRLRNGVFVSLCGADVSQINKLIQDFSVTIQRMGSISENQLTELAIKAHMPDVLNLQYFVFIKDNKNINALINLAELFYNQAIIKRVDAIPMSAPLP